MCRVSDQDNTTLVPSLQGRAIIETILGRSQKRVHIIGGIIYLNELCCMLHKLASAEAPLGELAILELSALLLVCGLP